MDCISQADELKKCSAIRQSIGPEFDNGKEEERDEKEQDKEAD
jgi:hypothetical protein